jgi:Ni,Fe-hydrogenase III component G
LYKLQFCNVYTQEVLREVKYPDTEYIKSVIEPLTNESNEFCYLLDSQQRLFQANYVCHTVLHMGNETVFRVFFKVKLNAQQPLFRTREKA